MQYGFYLSTNLLSVCLFLYILQAPVYLISILLHAFFILPYLLPPIPQRFGEEKLRRKEINLVEIGLLNILDAYV